MSLDQVSWRDTAQRLSATARVGVQFDPGPERAAGIDPLLKESAHKD